MDGMTLLHRYHKGKPQEEFRNFFPEKIDW
jgi:hypothetical protein